MLTIGLQYSHLICLVGVGGAAMVEQMTAKMIILT